MQTNPRETATTPGAMMRADVHDGQLEYEIRGDGDPVLYIHGAHVAGAFIPLVKEDALSNYRSIRYHRRGFAGSTAATERPDTYIEQAAADGAALLQHTGTDRAHIVGHSDGGVIALQMALDHPDRVHSLVLLEPALLMVPSGPAFAESLEPVVERYHAGDSDGAVDGFMQTVIGPNWRTDVSRVVPEGPEQAERDAATFFEVEFPAVGEWQFDKEKAEAISQPVLYVWGSESPSVLLEGKDLVHDWFPQAEEYRVPGVNHSLQIQDAPSVAKGIADFLSRHRV